MLLATNLSYEVRRIVKECFPKNNKLSKIINKNTVKTAYCTTENLEAKIKQHNTKILRENNSKKEDKTCNCSNTAECPVGGKCLTTSVVYTAEVNVTGREKLNKAKEKS